MTYVDGFVVPVPKRNVPAYRRLAEQGARIWKDYGALEYSECIAEDLDVKMGKSFASQLRLKRGETVFFSWIVYRSRAHRDEVNAKVMKDPRMAKMPKRMPFDVKRMLYGGFQTVVELVRRAPRRRPRRPARVPERKLRAPTAEPQPVTH
jgi:uncharacterized protein YbaA (DUF1428 family)